MKKFPILSKIKSLNDSLATVQNAVQGKIDTAGSDAQQITQIFRAGNDIYFTTKDGHMGHVSPTWDS